MESLADKIRAMPFPCGASTETEEEKAAKEAERQENAKHYAALAERHRLERERQDRHAFLTAMGSEKAAAEYTAALFRVVPANKSAFDAAVNFAPETENLMFIGPAGTGKSHLAAVAVRPHAERRWGNQGRAARTVKTQAVLREIRAAEGAQTEQAIIDLYSQIPVLLIDDLGVGKETAFALSVLYEIIDARYMSNRGGLVVTSNLGLDDLAAKMGDDRIPSRLAGMCKRFSFTGLKDYRLAVKPRPAPQDLAANDAEAP